MIMFIGIYRWLLVVFDNWSKALDITIKQFIRAAKFYHVKGRNFRGTSILTEFYPSNQFLGLLKNCEFRGTYFRDWIFIENFTKFILAMDRLERLQREIMKK